MFKQFVILTTLALIFSTPAFSQENKAPDEEPSSWDKIAEAEVEAKKDANDKLNRRIYTDSKQNLNEMVRAINGLNRLKDSNAKDVQVDVNNKEQLRGFIKTNVGMDDSITPPPNLKEVKVEEKKAPVDARTRSRRALQQ